MSHVGTLSSAGLLGYSCVCMAACCN